MSFKHRLQAWGELWKRYSQTFGYFWKQRNQIQGGLFREDEAAFLPSALAIQEAPPSKTARMIAWLLMGMVVTAFAWSLLGKMDIIVNAQGQVIPSDRTKSIASVETGSVLALHVQEGQRVHAGDVLLQLDTRVIDAERDKALGERQQAILALARNQALLAAIDHAQAPVLPEAAALHGQNHNATDADKWEAARLHLQGQWRDYQARYRKLAGDIAHYSRILPLAARQASSYRRLAASQDVSRDAWQDKEQQYLHLQAQLDDARNQQSALTEETRRNALEQMAEARRVAAASGQDALRAASAGGLLTLKAPVDGTVQQLSIHTIGGVVQAAQPLMQIVPHSDAAEVQAFIANRDKGFVHVGQRAAVKIDAFEYTKYGTLPGRVVHVSQDAIPDEKRGLLYAVQVRLDRKALDVQGMPVQVTPGMAVSVEIKTGERRVIEYVLSPLLRHTHEALNER